MEERPLEKLEGCLGSIPGRPINTFQNGNTSKGNTMNAIEIGMAGFMLWMILHELRGIADNVRRASDEVSRMKITINEIKEAVGDNAFEAMMSKPLPQTDSFGSLYAATHKASDEL
jgi:hypothetical protein